MIINIEALEELREELDIIGVEDTFSVSDTEIDEQKLGRIINFSGYRNYLFKAYIIYTDNFVFIAYNGDEVCYYTKEVFLLAETKEFNKFENSIHNILVQYDYSLIPNEVINDKYSSK